MARNPFENGKPFGVRATAAPASTLDLPTTLRTKSRFTVSPTSGSSVHFASNSSKRPPVSTTKSTSRVRSRQKKRLPVRPARRSRSRSWVQQRAKQAGIGDVEFWALDDGLGSIREPWLQQHDLAGSLQHGQPMLRCRRGNTYVARQICFVQQVCRTKCAGPQKSLKVPQAANVG